MGTLALWIGFNAAVLLLLVLDLGVFHRRAHAISVREAAAWSVVWVVLSLSFNYWILHTYGGEKALQFLTGYVIEKSLSVDNIFVFVLVFKSFGVEPRFQHRVLFWGILGALVLRGAMIALGTVLIARFEWVLYLFGAFLLVAGVRLLLHRDKEMQTERNPLIRLARKIFPVSKDYRGQKLWIREAGRLVVTPLFLVLLVIEGADLAFAVDSIPAVFGVTRDPFIVFTSNVCAILGLRAFYFLLVGALPYFRYLDEGLSVILLFVGGKMLAAPWVTISSGMALVIVAGILTVAMLASMVAARSEKRSVREKHPAADVLIYREGQAVSLKDVVTDLGSPDPLARNGAVGILFIIGTEMGRKVLHSWETATEFSSLLLRESPEETNLMTDDSSAPRATVGVAVRPNTFERIRKANGMPRLADVPPDQDAREFELHFPEGIRLDILTTKEPGGDGAIAKFLSKFGEGIQQVEYEVSNVDRATQILAEQFSVKAIYPATRPGADGTRVNFFLAQTEDGKKILIELVEPAPPEA
jgi:tellurite resistance protein TerC